MLVNSLLPSPRNAIWIAIFWTACAAAQPPSTEWTEAQVLDRFQKSSPQARELQSRVALAQADARSHAVYDNPSVSYSREGAGYNEFFEASQTLPLNGRIRLLRDAGAAAVSSAQADSDAVLWSLRSDLRAAFYRMVAAQERERAVTTGIREIEQLLTVLGQREQEGEGSRYDRLRAERELGELRTDLTAVGPLLAASAARLAAYLPADSSVRRVSGDLRVPSATPPLDDLVRRAQNARAEFRTAQKEIARYEIEEQAARRLRIPDPQVSGGVKRADVPLGSGPDPFSNATRTGVVFSLSVPLPVFNSGRHEVARYQAEQERLKARLAVLTRQIQADVEGAREVLAARRETLAAYQRETGPSADELTRITQVAYQEGEIGILELLDSLRVNRAARLRTLDLEAAVKDAFIELERVVGEELPREEVRP